MPQDPFADYLRTKPLTNQQRADLWDAANTASDANDLAARLQGLRVPNDIKADLWDLKSSVAPPRPAQTAPAASPQPQQGGMLSSLASGAGNFLRGAANSVASTVVGLGELASKTPILGQGIQAVNSALWDLTPEQQAASFQARRDELAPTTTAGKAGKVAGDVAQFFVPGGVVARGRQALSTGKGILDTVLGAALEGASAAGVDAAQRGTLEGTGITAATAGGTSAVMGGLGRALRPLGEKVEMALIKPSAADVRDGFKVDNIFKYDLGGSLSQTYDKAAAKLSGLTDELRAALNAPNASGRVGQVDVLGAIGDAAKSLSANQARTFGQNAGIETAVTKLLDDPLFQNVAQTGVVDVATANQIKQAMGEMGAWMHTGGRVVSDADVAMEKVANAVYRNLKLQIERSAGGDVGRINRQIADIIPIQTAIIRRIPVEQRQNVINLGDMIGFGTGTWGLALANRLLKSGQAANAMVGAGERAPAVAQSLGALAGAGASQAQQ